MPSTPLNSNEPREAGFQTLHIVTLSCLAFAQPILDLIGRSAEFLVIRRIGAADVAILLGVTLLVVPLPFVAIVFASSRAGNAIARTGVAIVVGFLAALIALRVETAAALLDGYPALGVAACAGIAIGILYRRRPLFRSFVTFLSPALLIVPLSFLLRPDVRRAISPPNPTTAARVSGARDPVFFLVFDALSFAALVDEHGTIDAARYPNLAKLAGSATWYRNAHTVADTTNVAIPAMLTSHFPRPGSLPLLADHPVNLFTILGGDYTIRADEPITRLCPPGLNSWIPDAPGVRERFTSLGIDLSIVWLHLELPPRFRKRLPSISNSWEEFAAGGGGDHAASDATARPTNASEFFKLAVSELTKGSRVDRFRRFIYGIDPERDKSLNFAHIMLPHTPWEHFPSGRLYLRDGGRIAGLDSDLWNTDPEPVRMGAVEYLMQTEFLDRLIGEFVTTLESKGLFDKALIVIVADHGTSFRPGDKRRGCSPGNAGEIVAVPLLIKAPRQHTGEVVDTHVTTLDILPTILEILGIAPDGRFEGHSTRIARATAAGPERIALADGTELRVDPAEVDAKKLEAARELRGMLGPVGDPYRTGRASPHHELLGQPVSAFPQRDGNLLASLIDPDLFRNYRPSPARVPAIVAGAVRTTDGGHSDLALAVNGTIVATARTGDVHEGMQLFGAILPESLFESAFDDVVIYRIVDGDGPGGTSLERTAASRRRTFSLRPDAKGRAESLVADGVTYTLGRTLDGWLEAVDLQGGSAHITGWATDASKKRLASEVVIFSHGVQVASGATWIAKGYVAAGFGEPAYMYSGFSFDVPAAALPRLARDGVRAFAVSDDGRATELGVLFIRVEHGLLGDTLVRSNGTRYSVGTSGIDGAIEAVEPDGEGIILRGWALDERLNAGTERVVVMLDGKAVREVVPSDPRADLARPGKAAPRCGFRMHFDAHLDESLAALRSGRARVFATAGGRKARELRLVPQQD